MVASGLFKPSPPSSHYLNNFSNIFDVVATQKIRLPSEDLLQRVKAGTKVVDRFDKESVKTGEVKISSSRPSKETVRKTRMKIDRHDSFDRNSRITSDVAHNSVKSGQGYFENLRLRPSLEMLLEQDPSLQTNSQEARSPALWSSRAFQTADEKDGQATDQATPELTEGTPSPEIVGLQAQFKPRTKIVGRKNK